MTTPDQPPALADRIETALRTTAYDCDGTCGLDERECDAQHPIQVAVLHHDQVATVYGDIPDLAAVAAAVVQPELDRRDAELARLRTELAAAQTRTATVLALPSATDDEIELMDPEPALWAVAHRDTLADVRRLLTTRPETAPDA